MSAIYGSITPTNKAVFSETALNYKKEYSKYEVERVEDIVSDTAFMGCAHQYFTPEAKRDVLPVEEEDILFTADVVLDNRVELLEALQLPSDTTDGAVVMAAYRKWRKDMFLHLHGVYAFAIYDKKAKEVILANDRFSVRCLFYTVRDGGAYFSTLLYPLITCSGLKFKKNQRWLVDEISQRGPNMITEPRETAIEGVYKIVSGTYVTISLAEGAEVPEANVVTYYEPEKWYKVNHRMTLVKSEEMARVVLKKTVGEFLRSEDQIAAQLSCGLDSTTVACNAAILLAEQGRTINSYTSVPLKEAGLNNKGYLVYDETAGVMKVVEAYPNIHPNFINAEGRVYLQEADSIIADWEMPCKSQQNSIWSDEIYKKAHEDGCKLMLTGATGNCTISAGSIENSLYDHLKHFRFIKAYRSLNVASVAGVSKKRYLKNLHKMVKKYKVWQITKPDYYEGNLTRRDVGEKFDVAKRHSPKAHYLPFIDLKEMRQTMFFPMANAQIGEVETKISLKYGILSRDPMRTDDMMKLCYSMPIECFSADDYDRRLVREGMKGVVPEAIRHDVQHRGRQSGDMYYRMSKVWDSKKDDIYTLLKNKSTLEYLDENRIDEWFEKLTSDNLEENSDTTLMVVDAYSFALYLQQLDKMLSM